MKRNDPLIEVVHENQTNTLYHHLLLSKYAVSPLCQLTHRCFDGDLFLVECIKHGHQLSERTACQTTQQQKFDLFQDSQNTKVPTL